MTRASPPSDSSLSLAILGAMQGEATASFKNGICVCVSGLSFSDKLFQFTAFQSWKKL